MEFLLELYITLRQNWGKITANLQCTVKRLEFETLKFENEEGGRDCKYHNNAYYSAKKIHNNEAR